MPFSLNQLGDQPYFCCRTNPDTLINRFSGINLLNGLIKSCLTKRACRGNCIEASPIHYLLPKSTKVGPWLWLVHINELILQCQTGTLADNITVCNAIQNNKSAVLEMQKFLSYTIK